MPKYRIARVEKTLYNVPPQLSQKQLRELGRECNTYGNTHCSHEVFAKIVRLDPRDYTALANLAMAQSHLGYHKFAIENFERALSQGVKAYDVYRFYGLSLLKSNQKEKAIDAFKTSLQLRPNQELLIKKLKSLE